MGIWHSRGVVRGTRGPAVSDFIGRQKSSRWIKKTERATDGEKRQERFTDGWKRDASVHIHVRHVQGHCPHWCVFALNKPPWHIWSSDFISCMHQYSSLSHMCFPHLAPFISNPLNTSRPYVNCSFLCDLFAVLALQIMSDTCLNGGIYRRSLFSAAHRYGQRRRPHQVHVGGRGSGLRLRYWQQHGQYTCHQGIRPWRKGPVPSNCNSYRSPDWPSPRAILRVHHQSARHQWQSTHLPQRTLRCHGSGDGQHR